MPRVRRGCWRAVGAAPVLPIQRACLGGHRKGGHTWSAENRPTGLAFRLSERIFPRRGNNVMTSSALSESMAHTGGSPAWGILNCRLVG
jgi:hypothetical protein